MKIQYDVVIADGFHIRYYPLPWPVADGDQEYTSIEIDFVPTSGDDLKDADAALDVYMKKNYPSKEYKIYYWWWLKG